jgi:hypothetical protein
VGVFYHVQPLDKEMAALLGEMGAAVPRFDGAARNPTPAEVREACGALRGFETRFNVKAGKHWQAVVEGAGGDEGTIVNVEKFKGFEDRPHSIWFEKGSPAVVLQIVKQLSRRCGPLVVLPDSGDTPVAVTATSSMKNLLRDWGNDESGAEE